MTAPAEHGRSGKRAAQRRKAAERARQYRARQKSRGAPQARDVDAAICEAVAFYAVRDGVNIGQTPYDLAKAARLILERDGYEPAHAAEAVAGRLLKRDEHTWPDHVPSLNPGSVDRMRPPVNRDNWITPLATVLRHFARKGDGVAPRP